MTWQQDSWAWFQDLQKKHLDLHKKTIIMRSRTRQTSRKHRKQLLGPGPISISSGTSKAPCNRFPSTRPVSAVVLLRETKSVGMRRRVSNRYGLATTKLLKLLVFADFQSCKTHRPRQNWAKDGWTFAAFGTSGPDALQEASDPYGDLRALLRGGDEIFFGKMRPLF